MLDRASWRKALLESYRRESRRQAVKRVEEGAWERPTQPVRVGPGRPTLERVLRERGPFPALSGILGMCDDGQPFLLDLADPTPGSILLAGNGGGVAMGLALSATAISRPSEVQVVVSTSRPATWAGLASKPHCRVFAAYEDAAGRMLHELAAVANQRRSGRERGAKVVLILDTLGEVWRQRDIYLESDLIWLTQHGPSSGVWVVGVAPVREGAPQMVAGGFGTQIYQRGWWWEMMYRGGMMRFGELEVTE